MDLQRQALRLALGALGPRLRSARDAAADLLFGLRAHLAFWLLAPATWLLALAMPGPEAAWRLCGRSARLLFRLAGARFEVRGLEHLPEGPCVLVSNHASYLDGVILTAALPRHFAFVAKRELAGQFVAGRFLRALGAAFVERFEVRRSVEDAERMADAVGGGASLAVFPEGTFGERPGLLPFHLGAFLAAARAGVPVLPVAIRGDRAMLPGNRWWPRRGAIEVRVCPPIAPEPAPAELFASAVRLRDSARRAIGRYVEGD